MISLSREKMIQQNTTENNIDSKKGSSKKSSIVSKMLVSLTGVATLTVLQLFNIQPLQYFENLNLTTTTTTTMTMTDIATIINDNTTEENFRNISSNLPIKELKTARKDKKNKKKKTNGVPMIPTTYDRNDNSTDNDTITYTNALKSTSFSCNYKRKRRGSSEQVCQCHVVHDVCIDHNNQKDIPYVWYYKYTNNSYYHQQNVNITIKQKKYRLNSFRVEHHLHSNKTAWPSSSSLSTKNNNCVESPIPNHMIVTDAYMEMIGEFYLSGYRKLMNIYVNLSKEDQLQFSTTTQLYLPTSKFLTSHETFLGLFTKHEVLSYLSFLQYGSNNNTNNNNNNNNTNRTSCTCLQHLYYCGSRESSKLIDTKANNRNNRKIKKLELSEIQQHTRSSAVSRPTLLTRPQFRRQLIQNHINRNSQQQQHQHGENNTNNNNNDYQTFIRNNNNRRGVVIDESEYKIIGLTQRSSRRKWLGLDEIIHECNRRWFHHHHYHHHQSRTNNTSTTTTTTTTTTKNSTNKVLCVEVNLETATISTPELQILWHTSMDGLVGIHGAQLTHAVFLPSHSLVVELLPWVMKGIVMGAWTKTVTAPTPIGILFEDTDLTHIGLPLDSSSASHIDCLQKSFTTTTTTTTITNNTTNNQANYQSSFECMAKSINRWDRRDFSVPNDKVLDLLQHFVVDVPNNINSKVNSSSTTTTNYNDTSNRGSSLTCQEYKIRASDEYVIYNTLCSEDPEKSNNKVHHFYREKEWSNKKTNCIRCTGPKKQQSEYFLRVKEEQLKRQEKKKKEQNETNPVDH